MKQFSVRTGNKTQFVDITGDVQAALGGLGVADGVITVFVHHTTAGVTINENADPDVVRDFLLGLARAVPDRLEFRHAEGNSAAHQKASLMGAAATVIVRGGRLLLGTWQGIYFCEFDGPRTRRFYVKIIEG